MFETAISIAFLCLILSPVIILFIALYQNLLEVVELKQGVNQNSALKINKNVKSVSRERALQLAQSARKTKYSKTMRHVKQRKINTKHYNANLRRMQTSYTKIAK